MKNILVFLLFLALLPACSVSQNCVEKIKPDCVCTLQYDPVCGCNKKTYGNACVAECAGIKTYTKGECPKDLSIKLEGTLWHLNELNTGPNAPKIPEDVVITIRFDSGKLDGNGGCNNFGGGYSLEGNNLKIVQLMSTKMFCEKAMKWESSFLSTLEKSKTYTLTGDTLELDCGEAGKLVFRPSLKKRN